VCQSQSNAAFLGEESVTHLFFECVVARVMWVIIGEFLGYEIGSNYISVASKWLQKEKMYGTNIISIVVLRSIWLTRNDLVFNKQDWRDVKQILRRMLRLTREWEIMVKEDRMEEIKRWSSFLERKIQEPLRIANV
jgi:hypothetical protein